MKAVLSRDKPRLMSLTSAVCSFIFLGICIYVVSNDNNGLFFRLIFFLFGVLAAFAGLSGLVVFIYPSMNSLVIGHNEMRWRGCFFSGSVRADCLKSIEVMEFSEGDGYIELTLISGETKKIPKICYGVFDSDMQDALEMVFPDVDIYRHF